MTTSICRWTIAGFVTATLAFTTAGLRAEQNPPAANPTRVSVTVNYTGAGTVDAGHRLWVWLFDNPNIGPDAMPIDERSIAQNGGTATFSTSSPQVYIAIAYDQGGGFMGQAPPPSGSPVMLYGMKGPNDPPQPVTPGAKGAVTVTFDDRQRMP